MSHLSKQIIQAALEKRPLDVQELFAEGVRAKAFDLVNECEIVFEEYDDEGETISEEELDEFFDKFNEMYGHLPEDEQMQIMADFEAELEEGNPDPATAVTHLNEPLAGAHKPKLKPEGSSPGGVENTGEMTTRNLKRKKTFKAEKNNHA